MLNRLKEFIEFKGVSVNKFEIIVGLGSGTILKALKNNNDIGVDKLIKIKKAFPELDINWIFDGERFGEYPYYMLCYDKDGIKYRSKVEWFNDKYLKKDKELKDVLEIVEDLKLEIKGLRELIKKGAN